MSVFEVISAFFVSLPFIGLLMSIISIIPIEIETLKIITGVIGSFLFVFIYFLSFSNQKTTN